MVMAENNPLTCSLHYALSLISGKWQPLILWHLSLTPDTPKRYGELKNAVPYNITHKTFTQQLRELEQNGLLDRQSYDEMPPRVEYSLTDKGKSLATLLYILRDWGMEWGDFPDEIRQYSQGVRNEEKGSYDYYYSNEPQPEKMLVSVYNMENKQKK